ncbi:hypothetical protein BU25DRAFT_457280 [Macroventuria anomochaeta]|uniref:Uncharacterized protein n=1 Tax=Macroventuria anomochaeta TaxID=301207 RepID=A0ACB6S459_9PLEO|nr:uncharacterized protein BU25DRAFT_457280 [Macroventuria anomochaeta]KAF2629025.1 hypothetical protein BU25DRAFT_457280 [Macroventuria anomochaeta]
MADPKIKREKSLGRPLSAIPSKRGGMIAMLFAAPSSGRHSDDDARFPPPKLSPRTRSSNVPRDTHKQPPPAKIKTEPADQNHAVAALPVPATHRELSPRSDRVRGVPVAGGSAGAQKLPVASWLSSRPISALATEQQTVVPTKTRPNHHFLASNSLTQLNRFLGTRSVRPTYTSRIARTARMEGFDFQDDNAAGFGAQMDMNALSAYTGAHDQVADMVTIPGVDYPYQQNYVQMLQNTNLRNQQHLERQHGAITELVGFNHNMHSAMHKLDARVAQLERDVAYFQTLAALNAATGTQPASSADGDAVPDGDNPSPSPAQIAAKITAKTSTKRPVADAFAAEGVTMPGRTKYRKKLEVKIPSKATGQAPGVGLPTPMPSALQTAPPSALGPSFPATPRTPYTPGRIGPPDSYKRTTTSINKRDIHNLNKSIPPANVQLPMVPLTDTEVIVYFFNSLSRPIVSLRLYARGWGPASIVQALNDHREVEPPYLRNTCSVKCTTAIKNGKKLYGDEWEAENRAVLAEAEDCRATDLIRADEYDTVDYYVRALGVNLKQHPTGADAGIFTACVRYCIENQASYTMSNVYQLAIDLQDGNNPQHPASPAPSDVAPIPQTPGCPQGDETEDEWTGDEAACSPLAERKSHIVQSAGSTGFTAVNAPYEQNDEDDE